MKSDNNTLKSQTKVSLYLLLALAFALLLGLANAQNAAQEGQSGGGQMSGGAMSGGQMSGGASPAVQTNVTVTDQQLLNAGQDSSNWLLHGRTYSNQRFSPLDQISASNVKNLQLVRLVQTGVVQSFETTPVVVNGIMYVTTPYVSPDQEVIAYNAATGKELWRHKIQIGYNQLCCGPVNRGVTVAYGKLFMTTVDAHLMALDAKTGDMVWDEQVANPNEGYSETMTPQVYDGMVIVGSAGGEWPLRGFVAAYNADNGKQIWRWHTTPGSGEPGNDTWSGDSWKTGGGAVWTTPAIDPKQGLVIFSVGNPNPDLYGKERQGDNLYTDSIVALNVKNGKLAWYYQEVPHDVWDYDAVSNVLLFNVEKNGQTIPAAGEAGKVGSFFIVDRRNGKLITKSEPFVMERNMFAKPTPQGVKLLPGANGGSEWSAPAFSPKTHDVYVLGMNQLMKFVSQAPETKPGAIRLGGKFTNVPVNAGGIQNGTFTAINVNTGKIDWQYQAPQPLIGGALATGGNLVFTGEGNGNFDAFNAKTGQLLWTFNLGAGVNAPPMTYEVNGQQYIAVAAGGNFQLGYPYGDAIAIFSLPQ